MRIVADTSALVAVVLGENDAQAFAQAMVVNEILVSSVSLLEASIVVSARQGPDAKRDLDLLVAETSVQVVEFDQDHVSVAFAAWLRFGKGRHAAQLNFGDCATYATAKLANAPLLFKGNDFTQTDLALL